MADSLFEVVDWTDLTSAEYSMVSKLLQSATQERFSVAMIDIDEDLADSAAKYDYFDYGSNTPNYTFNAGDPVIYDDSKITSLITSAIPRYVDTAKVDDQIGTTSSLVNTLKDLADTADAPLTYASRLLEISTETDYPDYSGIAAESTILRHYNLINNMKYISRLISEDLYVGSNGKHLITGSFDNTNPINTLFSMPNGARDFGAVPPILLSNTTPYANFKTAHDNLFSGSDTDDMLDPAGTHTPTQRKARYFFYWAGTGTAYQNWIRSFALQVELDYGPIKTQIGFGGLPLSFDLPSKMDIGANSAHTGFTAASFRETDLELYYAVLSESWTTNVVNIDIDDGVTLFTIPSTLPTSTGSSRASVDFDDVGRITELWDGEGGFDYYTPVP